MENDFEKIIEQLIDYKFYLDKRQSNRRNAEESGTDSNKTEVSRNEFTLLLGGISSFRRTPGIPAHMGFETLYHCETKEDEENVKKHLDRLFGITDKNTLMEACYNRYNASDVYDQFMTFWANAPMFDVNRLNENGRRAFELMMSIAINFYPLVKEKGFYAWDINERIGLCRLAVAGGIISEEEFWKINDNWVRMAQVFYHSFEEYAYSCLCGAVYFMLQEEAMNEDSIASAEHFLNLNINILNELFAANRPWDSSKWYKPKEREYAVGLTQVGMEEKTFGCMVTKKAIDTEKIGYMYREEPQENCPDSGWRFFVGDEDDAYVNNPDNVVIVTLDTICNIEPTVIAYMYAETGRRFGYQDGKWIEE